MKVCIQCKVLALPGLIVGSATILLVVINAFPPTQ